ncbi:hypothetical protein LTR37_003286 [Vermiconidia calcicola]|uniref:Uncharacterized protein n=1 Tax=Vermiconidia calcicola TaxID=1690605 RepID=A0ACC3NQH8_9PEZI|nr:hypothetical protein LTR37_003286 [Vermiconidia calcicola]
MLAKAYSIKRESREEGDVPLDEYFETCAPLIRVVPPNEYRTDIVPGSLEQARARSNVDSESLLLACTSVTGTKLELTVTVLANTVTVIPVEPSSSWEFPLEPMAATQVINASQSSAVPGS